MRRIAKPEGQTSAPPLSQASLSPKRTSSNIPVHIIISPASLHHRFMISWDYWPFRKPRVNIMDYEDLFEPLNEPADPDEFDDGVEM